MTQSLALVLQKASHQLWLALPSSPDVVAEGDIAFLSGDLISLFQFPLLCLGMLPWTYPLLFEGLS